MNKQEAMDIAASPAMAQVTYQGTSVYIQHVDEQKETARIYPLGEPENEQEVPISQLVRE